MGFLSGLKDFLLGSSNEPEVEEVDWLPEGKLGAYEEGHIYLKEDLPEEKKQKVLEHELAHREYQGVHPHSGPEDLAAEEVEVTLATHGELTGRRVRNTISSIAEQFGLDNETAEDAFYEGAMRVLDEEDAYLLAQYLDRT